ncbi:MAG: hypothetical protein HY529_06235 [Chloroflexi bacterium]|nr:hypothetical protein [Chloroflexota bacterium]
MAKRTRKPPVKPEKRLEWLHRVDNEGETLVHISESDGFDIRTVRKQIEAARLERDVQRARTEVLRDTLVAHYHDLLETVQSIDKQISDYGVVSMGKEQPLMFGLQQHMPRSPLWENLRKWNRTVTELNDLLQVIPNKIREVIETDGRLNRIASYGAGGVTSVAVEVLVFQMKAWARDWQGLHMQDDIHVERTPEGKLRMRYGFASFGELEDEGSVEVIKAVLTDLEPKLRLSPEYLELGKLYGRLRRLGIAIREVVTLIRLRRIVPGKCKYCPL